MLLWSTVSSFTSWAASLRQTARSNQLVLVDALVEYGKQLYELGRSKHSFSETVNAVIEKSPHLKPVMGAAWALISTWEKLHPTKVHPPMPWPMLQALVVTMLAWGWWRLALTSSLGCCCFIVQAPVHYILRAVPPDLTAVFAAEHDRSMLHCLALLLQVHAAPEDPLPNLALRRLGLRSAAAHAPAAYFASWADSLRAIRTRESVFCEDILQQLAGPACNRRCLASLQCAAVVLTNHGLSVPVWGELVTEPWSHSSVCGPGQWLDQDGVWHSSPCKWDQDHGAELEGEAAQVEDGDDEWADDLGEEEHEGADAEDWDDDADGELGAHDLEAEWPEDVDAEQIADEKAVNDGEQAEWPEATEAVEVSDEKAEWPDATEAVEVSGEQVEWPITEAVEVSGEQVEWPVTEAVEVSGEQAEGTEAMEVSGEQVERPEVTVAMEVTAKQAEWTEAMEVSGEQTEWPAVTEAMEVSGEQIEWPEVAEWTEPADEKYEFIEGPLYWPEMDDDLGVADGEAELTATQAFDDEQVEWHEDEGADGQAEQSELAEAAAAGAADASAAWPDEKADVGSLMVWNHSEERKLVLQGMDLNEQKRRRYAIIE
eukprot:s5083_g5.t1